MNARRTQTAGGTFPGFRPVPRTGVIYVMTEAAKRGFHTERQHWANLGQGAPETGPLADSPERILSIACPEETHEYTPVAGLAELRDAVAELYNQRYRTDKKSKYTRENIAICSGGRLALTRLVSTLGSGHIGHFLPDYTAYEELLGSFGTFVPMPILTNSEKGAYFNVEDLRHEIIGRGLSAVLLSNPSNPTGRVIDGDELRSWVETCRNLECALILDEFYSHYLYDTPQTSLSAAEFVEDVNEDPVILFDGLTKNWRYPGFRVAWTVGPKSVIDSITSAGSFIDGGSAHPMQLASLPLVNKAIADQEASAIHHEFSKKRDFMHEALRQLGIQVEPKPRGGFYCWANLSELPASIKTGLSLFEKAIEKNLIIVPGVFFDINPGKRRPNRISRFGSYARFSFGPPMDELKLGLSLLKEIIDNERN